LELSLSRKSLGRVLEHRILLQLCLSIEKSLGSVLDKFVIQYDYSEFPWKCKEIGLLLDCRRYRLCMLSLSLYLCAMNLIYCIQTLYTSDSDQVLTLRKRNNKKPTHISIAFFPCLLHYFKELVAYY
jgi:hypothetical protein